MNKNENKEFIGEVKRVFSSLVLIAPFAYPILTMPVILREIGNSPAATNGVSIFINKKRWEELSFNERMFVSLHEWMHIALMHSKRIKTRNHRTYNYAADFAINLMIKDELNHNFEMSSGLYDEYYRGKTSEEIYKDLDEEVRRRQLEKIKPFCSYCKKDFEKGDYASGAHLDPNIKKCPACMRPIDKNIEKPKEISREDAINQLMSDMFGAPWGNDVEGLPLDANEQEIVDQIIKAAARFKQFGKGNLPGHYEDFINSLNKSKIPWTRLLYKYVKESLKGKSDRNPFKPDPKYLPFDVFVPREVSQGVAKLVFILDTSRSMDTEDFKSAAGQLERLSTLCENVHVIMADTMVQKTVKIRNLRNELKKGFVIKGRGGTDMAEAFEAADKMNPNLIILFSDMKIGIYPPKPKAPIIFLDTLGLRSGDPKYGIRIKIKNERF